MKLLKSLLVGVLLLNTVIGYSQEEKVKKSPEERATHITEKMTKEFSLNKKEAEQVGQINLDFMLSVMSIKDNKDLSKEEKMSSFDKVSETHSQELKAVLSSEDFEKFEIKKAEKKAKVMAKKAEHNKPEFRAEKRSEKMFEIIPDLTEDQKKQIQDLNLMVENKIQAIKSDESMSDEKKKEFIKGNRKDQKHALKSILTDEQIAALEKAKAEKKAEKSEK